MVDDYKPCTLATQIGDKGAGGWPKGDRPSGDDRTGRVGTMGQTEGCFFKGALLMAG